MNSCFIRKKTKYPRLHHTVVLLSDSESLNKKERLKLKKKMGSFFRKKLNEFREEKENKV
tara:strand:+ start:515 stop:694 length:180 start_codon:yes stop_codon:yes gene_type:complete